MLASRAANEGGPFHFCGAKNGGGVATLAFATALS